MSDLKLVGAKHTGDSVQIWTATPDTSKKTSGTVDNVVAAWCHADGTIDVTFEGAAAAETWDHLVAGDQVGFMPKCSVAITSGTWSFMVAA